MSDPKPEQKGMLQRLQNKWQVRNILQVLLILCTFAIGGSLCGYLGRIIMPHIYTGSGVTKAVIYILMVTLLWPLCVLLVSIPFGQFGFFRKYLRQLGLKIIGRRSS